MRAYPLPVLAISILAASVSAASGPAAPAAAAAGAIPLETVSDLEMGYRIPIPKGAKVLNKTSLQHTYSLVLSDRMHEINVSLAAALATVQMAGGEQVLEKSELGPGQYDIVALWGPRMQQVHAYRRKGRVSIRAKCAGPATHADLLKQICRSLEIVK